MSHVVTLKFFFFAVFIGWVSANSCLAHENLFREARRICIDSGGDLDRINSSANADGWASEFTAQSSGVLSAMGIRPTGVSLVKHFGNEVITLMARQKINPVSGGEVVVTSCELFGQPSNIVPATSSARKYFRSPPLKDSSGEVEWIYTMDKRGIAFSTDSDPENIAKYLNSGSVYILGIITTDGNNAVIYRKLSLVRVGENH